VSMAPLTGVRVLDMSRIIAGPMCGFYLASLGAEVVRIEVPGGDLTWKVPPFYGPRGESHTARQPDEIPLGFIKRNRGKRNVVIDLRNDAGRDVLHQLAAQADVVIENMRPGVLDRLGAGYAELSALNPRLVYCSMTGYGQTGPYRDRQAMDVTVQAASGVQARTGFADGPPVKIGPPVGDLAAAVFASLGIVSALHERERTGLGQYLDVSMHDVLTSWLWDESWDVWSEAGRLPRYGNAEPRGVPSNTYRSADGWVALLVTDDLQWARLADLMQRPDLARYATNLDRVPTAEVIDAAVGEWCAAQAADEVAAALRAIEVPVSVVEPPWVGRSDPHVAARHSLVPLFDHRGSPTGRLGPRLPILFSSGELDAGATELMGAGTADVLASWLGYDEHDVAALRSRGAFGPAGPSDA